MQNITIYNQDREKLVAYLFEPPTDVKYMLIICHGFRGAKENGGKIFGWAEKLNRQGIGVLAFDFRGSGQSDGDFAQITLTRQADDLQQVIDYVHDRFSKPIILLGRSFGGSTVLVGGAGDPRVAGYILWSTPVFMRPTFSIMLPNECQLLEEGNSVVVGDEYGEYRLLPGILSDFEQHNMDAYLQNIGNRPVLAVHARDDEVVDYHNALYIKEQLPNCTLHMIDEAGHRFLDNIELREDITIKWLQDLFLRA